MQSINFQFDVFWNQKTVKISMSKKLRENIIKGLVYYKIGKKPQLSKTHL